MGSTNNENNDSDWNYGAPGVVNRRDAYFAGSPNEFDDLPFIFVIHSNGRGANGSTGNKYGVVKLYDASIIIYRTCTIH